MGTGDNICCGMGVNVGVGVGVDVAVGDGVLVGIGVGVSVGAGVEVGVGVLVGSGVDVGVGVEVGTGVDVGFGVSVGTGEGIGVSVGSGGADVLGCRSAWVSCGAAKDTGGGCESGVVSGSLSGYQQPTGPAKSSTAVPAHNVALANEASQDLLAIDHCPLSNFPRPATCLSLE